MRGRQYILALLALVTVSGCLAQDKFLETLNKAQQATTYEAIYILSEYQRQAPTSPAIYYHLGWQYYNIISIGHPIREHTEFNQILYRVKLYWGDCLHYAQNQHLKAQYFAGLPYAGKKPEYADLERFVQAKLDSVEHTRQMAETVYQNYYRLVNRYAYCRNIFTTFSEFYTREKMAHLLLTKNDYEQLATLQLQADSLRDDIRQLQASLEQYPIAGYKPEFTWEEIHLYRLDGLTSTDLLQNNVSLWDYGTWVKTFLHTQETTYSDYYDALDIEFGLMQRAIAQMQAGEQCKFQPYDILLNLIDRLDYQSFMKDLMALMQQTVSIMQYAQDSVFKPKEQIDEDYIEQAVDVLYKQYHSLTNTNFELTTATYQLRTYADLLNKWGLNHPDSLQHFGHKMQQLAAQTYTTCATAFAQNIQPTLQPFTAYVNELSGEQFGIENMKYLPADIVVAILPMEQDYLVVLQNGTCQLCSAEGQLLQTQTHEMRSPVITAYKYGSNNVAVISRDEVLFVDKTGK